ncbi:hypothetical protein ASG87_18890 [Frateuria sp. Soil773]|nr:hypothetical protein ASG87_18890 [Frateuria sp. Soil773]
MYLQADHSVTDGIFMGEHVLFPGTAAGWRQFCEETLGFAVPEDVLEAERQVQKDLEALQVA